jgi:putative DNA primase/helicase
MQHKIESAHQEPPIPMDIAPMPTEIDASYEVLEPDPEPPEIRVDLGDPKLPGPVLKQLLDAGLILTKSGHPMVHFKNITKLLAAIPETKDSLWEDTFHNQLFLLENGKPRPWRDNDLLSLMGVLQDKYWLHKLNKLTLEDAVANFAASKARSEPLDWLSTLKWDGTSRIENFMAECMDAEPSKYTFAVSKNFWISMVARIKRPGCKVDNMVVFEGPQGSMKSSALHAIGGKWFGELNERPDSKDFVLALSGKLLLEIAELDSFRRAESTTIKRIITTQVDRLRKPYGRVVVETPRSCIFAGTTNEVDYLQDQTGGRRFWPIKCGKIDLDKIHFFREQAFAEACYLYEQGEKWYIVPDTAKEEQELRTYDDSWMDLVAPFVYGKPEVKLIDILTQCLDFDSSRIKKMDEMRISTLLKKLGYSKKTQRKMGIPQKLWVKELSDEEKQATPVSHQPKIPNYLD